MLLSRRAALIPALLAPLALALALVDGCGARSGLARGDSAPLDAGVDADAADVSTPSEASAECALDVDCPTLDLCAPPRCLGGSCEEGAALECDDQDPCTGDACDPESGACVFAALSFDEDGDGFRGPRPGFSAGTPGSCGEDCDDTSRLAFPGGNEVCDGVDNDCNGVVDDGAQFVPIAGEVQLTDQSTLQSSAGGLVWGEDQYVATYASQTDRWRTFIHGLTATGQTAPELPPASLTNVNNDTTSGPVVFTGSVFGTVWEDRRDNNYELYFNRFDAQGQKLAADVRVSDTPQFSINSDLLWNGAEYIAVWQEGQGAFGIEGQRISIDGRLLGQPVTLAGSASSAESARISQGESRMGMVFTSVLPGRTAVSFRSFAPDLTDASTVVRLQDDNGVYPRIAHSGGRFVVAWGTRDTVPGNAIWGATVSEQGDVLVANKQLTFGATFARSHYIVPLGDRVLLFWADDFDGNYELYAKQLTLDLDELSPRVRLTNDPSDTVTPIAAFSQDGELGVLFNDRRSGGWQVYFTRLGCIDGTP